MSTTAIVGALLILPEGPRPLTLRLQGDTIIAVGGTPNPTDTIIDLTGHVIFPGLINALDRLEESNFPPFKMRTRYDNAREWRNDLDEQSDNDELRIARQSPEGDRLFIGALANVLNGVTTVLHTGQAPGPFASLRKLPIQLIDCWTWAQPTQDAETLGRSFAKADPDCPWLVSAAECIDGTGSEEFRVLELAGCLAPNTIIIHALDLGQEEIEMIHEKGASIIWTPGANLHVLGETHLHHPLVNRTALGTGSRLMGSRGLLHELKLARQYSQLPSRHIVKMATEQSAKILRKSGTSGTLTVGAGADLVIIQNRSDDPYSQLVDSERSGIDLVIVRGRPVVGARNMLSVFDRFQQRSTEFMLDGRPSLIAGDIWRRYRRIRLNLRGVLSN